MRLPFCRERVLRIVMRRPFWGTQMRIARLYLRQGIGAQKLAAMTAEEEMAFSTSTQRSCHRWSHSPFAAVTSPD